MDFIDLPEIEPGEGLTISEMVGLGFKVKRSSWEDYSHAYHKNDCPYEAHKSFFGLLANGFGYDYGGRLDDLMIYLASHEVTNPFRRDLIIKVMKGRRPIGYSGILRKKANPELYRLIEHAGVCCSENEIELRRKQHRTQEIMDEEEYITFQNALSEIRAYPQRADLQVIIPQAS